MKEGKTSSVLPGAGVECAYTQSELEQMDTDELDAIAFGCRNGEVKTLKPSAIRIKYPCDLENPQHRFEQEGMAWVRSVSLDKPVSVSVDDNGVFWLEDGHHRWFAATKRRVQLQAEIEIKGNPVRAILNRQQKAVREQDPEP